MNHRPFFAHQPPIMTGHRGGAGLWPENTLPSFRGAVQLGCRYLETDLHATRDGVLVCLHDDSLDRTTNGRGLVWEQEWAAVEALDAGYWFAPEDGYPWRGRGAGVPRLEEVLGELPGVFMTLELKQDGIEELLVGAVDELDAWDRVLVGSFHDERLRRVRRLSGGRVATSAGQREVFYVWAASRMGVALPSASDALQVPVRRGRIRLVDGRLVDAAHRSGKQVHVWTVNAPAEMHQLLDLGVDGLITDRPDILQRVLAERPLRSFP
ncbi:MAG: glycerophosphodiester phosphodiesterase [Actinomycetota bacterium]|nr:glycerophosphodiester phosphodiesterase [Actinomycetota bacterium]